MASNNEKAVETTAGTVFGRSNAAWRRAMRAARGKDGKDKSGKESAVPAATAAPSLDGPDAAIQHGIVKTTEKYAYAEATERVMRKAAAMTSGRQDDKVAASVAEALEAMNHEASATAADMDDFASDYMASATKEAQMGD